MCKVWDGLLKSLRVARINRDWEHVHELLNTLMLMTHDKWDKAQINSIKENIHFGRNYETTNDMPN